METDWVGEAGSDGESWTLIYRTLRGAECRGQRSQLNLNHFREFHYKNQILEGSMKV